MDPLMIPPLSLSWPSRETAEPIDWRSPQKIDSQYVAKICACVERNFPQRTNKWGSSPYPVETLKGFLNLGPEASFHYNKEISQLYNPYSLRLPYSLQAVDQLFDSGRISRRSTLYSSPNVLDAETATEQYLNFLRQYHLLYVDLLQAINGSGVAISNLKDKLYTNSLYVSADIDPKFLKNDNKSVEFRESCLAYLVIDVLRSPDEAVGTAARVCALELLFQHFDLKAVASSFDKNCRGFRLPYSVKDEPVEDMIPRSFMERPEEKGGTPHNDLFLKNAKVRKLFRVHQDYRPELDFDAGVSVLLQRYPAETVQILLSLIRVHSLGIDRKLVFHTLVGLSKLDHIQKGELFGIKASYRAVDQHGKFSGLQSRIGATTGVGTGFGDDLDSLSREQLQARLRQTINYLNLVEENLASKAGNSGAYATSSSGARFTDSQGYFKVLGLASTTNPEDFEILLTACYRTLARKMHPDKAGDTPANTKAFQHLLRAYETLKDPRKRKEYLNS
jgi:hypothetical protein